MAALSPGGPPSLLLVVLAACHVHLGRAWRAEGEPVFSVEPGLGRLDGHRVEAVCQEALRHSGGKQLRARLLGHGTFGTWDVGDTGAGSWPHAAPRGSRLGRDDCASHECHRVKENTQRHRDSSNPGVSGQLQPGRASVLLLTL